MIMVSVMLVITVLSLISVCIAGYVVAAHGARAAADLAALSGAVALSQGRDGCTAARTNAVANDVTMAGCDTVGDAHDFVISVRTRATVTVFFPGLPSEVFASAHAGTGG
jgi:secretion/DNA translocation related TadE-like protein